MTTQRWAFQQTWISIAIVYDLVKYVHILCAVTWVGGAFYAQLLAIQVARSPDPADLPKLGRHIEFLGTRVFLPASILLFIAA
jgi:hypothetical protein